MAKGSSASRSAAAKKAWATRRAGGAAKVAKSDSKRLGISNPGLDPARGRASRSAQLEFLHRYAAEQRRLGHGNNPAFKAAFKNLPKK